jgi:hypothetical protein
MRRRWAEMSRGQRGRAIARAELAIGGVLVLGLTLHMFIAGPGFLDPMFLNPTSGDGTWLRLGMAPLLAYVAAPLAYGWMIGIYRASPEPDQQAWRYRERD